MAASSANPRVIESKLVLLGDSNVGKTSLVLRFVKNQFNADPVSTVGAAFLQSPVTDDSLDEKIQFGIWDTAGSERYKALAPMYYRGAEVAIVVYDITSFKSFEGAKNWVRDLKLYGQPNVVIALAANKCDLDAQFREVSAQEGQAYARDEDMAYFEARAAHEGRVALGHAARQRREHHQERRLLLKPRRSIERAVRRRPRESRTHDQLGRESSRERVSWV